MEKLLSILKNPEFWVGIIGVAAVAYFQITGQTLDQKAALDAIMFVVAVVGSLAGARVYSDHRTLSKSIDAQVEVEKAEIAAQAEVQKTVQIAQMQMQMQMQQPGE